MIPKNWVPVSIYTNITCQLNALSKKVYFSSHFDMVSFRYFYKNRIEYTEALKSYENYYKIEVQVVIRRALSNDDFKWQE